MQRNKVQQLYAFTQAPRAHHIEVCGCLALQYRDSAHDQRPLVRAARECIVQLPMHFGQVLPRCSNLET